LRKEHYPSVEELVVALWELVIENKTEKSTELQNARRLIKEKYQDFIPKQYEDDQELENN
jgi:non-homologous end joining protein Ku